MNTPSLCSRLQTHWRTAAAALALISIMAPAAAQAPAKPAAAFDEWSERFAADWVRLSAERASMTQYFSGAEQAALERQLTPLTPERRALQGRLAREGLARLDSFDAASLTPEQRVSAAILRWSLQREVQGEPYQDHNFLFSQLGGPHVRLVSFMTEQHPLRQPADVAAYLERLAQVDQRLDEGITRARAAVARGLLPPRFIAERARSQVVAVLTPLAAQSDYVSALARRTENIAGLKPEDRQQAISSATKLVDERVLPAYRRVLALLDEVLPRTTP